MKKVKSNVKVIALAAAVSMGVIGAGYQYMTNASESKVVSENSIGLNVEKQSKDKIKVYLSNFSDLATCLQLSVKIEEGNVKFDDESINWLVKGDNVQKNYKIDNDKKVIDFFIVSNEPINAEGGNIEICEINVAKDKSIIDTLIKSNDKGYKIVPNVEQGEAYSYVTYSSNKRIGGDNIANVSDEFITMNTNPTIKFKDDAPVVNNQIIISKGSTFNIKDYVEAYDSEGNEITDIKYEGKIDNKNVGTYNIVCKATDSYGDSSTLEVSVSVEESGTEERTAPIITGNDKPLEVVIGKDFDLKEGMEAVDYMGRPLELIIAGDFATDKVGSYIMTYSATDIFNKTTTVERTLIVSEEKISSGTEEGSSSNKPGNSSSNSGNSTSNSENNTSIIENEKNDELNNPSNEDKLEGSNDNVISSDNLNISNKNNTSGSTAESTASQVSEKNNNKNTNNNISKDKTKIENKISSEIKPKEEKDSEEVVEEIEIEEKVTEISGENLKEEVVNADDIKEDANNDLISGEKSYTKIFAGAAMFIIGIGAAVFGVYLKKINR